MATLISIATGNFTSASTWAVADTTSELDSEVGSTGTTTSFVASSNFTPGAITIDAIAVKIRTSTAGTGTFTVELFNSTGSASIASVTVNVSDLAQLPTTSADPGWYVFPIGSTLLVAATNYQIRVKSSVTGSVAVFRDATAGNWSRILRTTTTAAPAVNDKLIIVGELTGAGTGNSFTVTMDNTATTSFGPTVSGGPPQGMFISKRGTLTFGTTASTNYYLKLKGILRVTHDGTLNIGTAITQMPSTSTAVLEFDSVANVDSGLSIGDNGNCNIWGDTKTNVATLMTVDKAAAATTLSVSDTTGWAASDDLAIASTTRTAGDCEKKTILTVDSGVQVTLTAGLSAAHSGTSPTQAEVINLTHNVKIRGISTSLQGYIFTGSSSTTVLRYAEIYNMGSATSLKRGIDVTTITGSFDMQYCSLHDFVVTSSIGVLSASGTINNFTISNCVLWNINAIGISTSATTGTNWTISNCIVIGASTATGINLSDYGGTLTGCTAVGCTNGFVANENNVTGTWSNLTAHSNTTNGFALSGFTLTTATSTIINLTAWRNNSQGVLFGGANGNARCSFLTLDSPVLFGNSAANFSWFGGSYSFSQRFINISSNGDTTFSTTNGFQFQSSVCAIDMRVENSSFSVVSGIKTAHTNDITLSVALLQLILQNTLLAGTTEVGSPNQLAPGAYVRSQKHDQTAGLHRAWYQFGQIDIDTTTFKTASPAEKLTPSSATGKLESGVKRAAVVNGGTITPTVYVNKSASYNGNQPRLVVKKNLGAGVTADAVLATASGGTGTWLLLTGTTAAVTDDAVLEFVVDIDGTAGTVSVDDWSAV